MDFNFNINHYVKVKLTDYGIRILKQQHDELNEEIIKRGGKGIGIFQINQDKEGYTEFQMWELMKSFGHVMFNGGEIPFETNIIVTKGEPLN